METVITENDFFNSKLPFIISLVSGKGGVGKSVISANLANKLANDGFKVLLWDGDFHFPNLHIIFGVDPPVRAKDVYYNKIDISKVFYKISANLHLIADYAAENTDEEFEVNILIDIFKYLLVETDYDFILIDTSAGLNEMMLNFINFSHSVALIINDEPTTLLDGYALTKILLNFVQNEKIKILVNNVIDAEDFQEIISKFNLVTEKFLKLSFESLGFIPYNRIVRKSLLNQELFSNNNNIEISNKLQQIVDYYIALSKNVVNNIIV